MLFQKPLKAFAFACAVLLSTGGPDGLVGVDAATKAQECEVCASVVNQITESIPAESRKSKMANQRAIAEWCGSDGTQQHFRKGLNNRDRKLCYYLDPIMQTVAHSMALKMPAMRVCKKLTRDNPDICEITYPVKIEADVSEADLGKMRVKTLKGILADRGVDCPGCLEKSDFVKRVKATQHMDL